MALENDIQELTAAIHLLLKTMVGAETNTPQAQNQIKGDANATGVQAGAEAVANTEPAKKETTAKKDKAATTLKSSPASAQTTEKSSEDSATPVIEYLTIQAAVLDISKNSIAGDKAASRKQAEALLQRFGALKDGQPAIRALDEKFYAKVMEFYPKIMSGEIDATAGLPYDDEDDNGLVG